MAGVPSLACEPDSEIVPSSFSSNFLDKFPTLVSDDDSEDENPPLPTHVPPIAPAPILPRRVRSTCEVVGDLAGDLFGGEPLLFWLKFSRIMIQKLLQKL